MLINHIKKVLTLFLGKIYKLSTKLIVLLFFHKKFLKIVHNSLVIQKIKDIKKKKKVIKKPQFFKSYLKVFERASESWQLRLPTAHQ